MEEENKNSDSTKVAVDFNSGKNGIVQVNADPRLEKLVKLIATPDENGDIIKGYRVQIFFDTDKNKTDREKAKFKTRYGNSMPCYVEYKAPNYRIKVGDFRSEIDAERFKQGLLSVFPTAFVVKEKIKLPTLPNIGGNEN